MINKSFMSMRRDDLTTILILEQNPESNSFYYNIPYLVDGLVKLDTLELGTSQRRLFIPKMRWTNQHKGSVVYEIGDEGFIISDNGMSL